jgi:hypothetical protein
MERKTYLIAIDGMRADYAGATGHQGCLTPTMIALTEQGIQCTRCKVPLPAVTAANHTALMTSTTSGTNGIYGMIVHYKGLDFNHPKVSRQYGTPLLDVYQHSHLQGIPTFFNVIKMNNPSATTAIVSGKHWVAEILADNDCDIVIYGENPSNPDFVTPAEGYILGGKPHEKDSFRPPRIYIPTPRERFIGRPKGTLKSPLKELNADRFPSDKWVIDQAIQTIRKYDPDFMYILLNNVDIAGHTYGSFSNTHVSDLNKFTNPDAMKDQMYITDGEIKRLITFLKKRGTYNTSRIIISSDHGMSTMKEKNYAVDIRKLLKNHGIAIKANTRWLPGGYNEHGQYEWCFSEGTHIYLYCPENAINTIKKVIEQHLPHLHEVLDPQAQMKRGVWKGNYKDVIWPQLLVFLEPNYMNIGYADELSALASVVAQRSVHVQALIAKAYGIPSAPGAHGTFSEEAVPLIFVSPDESKIPKGITLENNVSILDIIPSVNYLNGWPDQRSFEGTPLFVDKCEEIRTRTI